MFLTMPLLSRFRSVFGRMQEEANRLILFSSSRTPARILVRYLLSGLGRRLFRLVRRKEIWKSKLELRGLLTQSDWFSNNVSVWLQLFERFKLAEKPLQALEIGSWEGMSAFFLLRNLPNCQLTCVDTWQGSDEHNHYSDAVFRRAERNFQDNMARFGGRVEVFKGSSTQYFASMDQQECFDFIYIDGSHHADDVAHDGKNAFTLLRPGGLMVFDDYLWPHYPDIRLNPITPINEFLYSHRSEINIVSIGYQVIIEKVRPAN